MKQEPELWFSGRRLNPMYPVPIKRTKGGTAMLHLNPICTLVPLSAIINWTWFFRLFR